VAPVDGRAAEAGGQWSVKISALLAGAAAPAPAPAPPGSFLFDGAAVGTPAAPAGALARQPWWKGDETVPASPVNTLAYPARARRASSAAVSRTAAPPAVLTLGDRSVRGGRFVRGLEPGGDGGGRGRQLVHDALRQVQQDQEELHGPPSDNK
jgi:hypothetical protein